MNQLVRMRCVKLKKFFIISLSLSVFSALVITINNDVVKAEGRMDSVYTKTNVLGAYQITDVDTLGDLSFRLNVSTNRLQQFRNLKKGYVIPVGEEVIWGINPKNNREYLKIGDEFQYIKSFDKIQKDLSIGKHFIFE